MPQDWKNILWKSWFDGITENEVHDQKYTRKYRVVHTPIKRIRSSASVNIIQPLPIFLRKNGLLNAWDESGQWCMAWRGKGCPMRRNDNYLNPILLSLQPNPTLDNDTLYPFKSLKVKKCFFFHAYWDIRYISSVL